MPSRHAHWFQCTECSWFNRPMLSERMYGNYTIICGNCGHEHYRVIKQGVVTEDRHHSKYGESDTIHVMPSACFKTKLEEKIGEVVSLKEKEAAGLVT